MYLVLKEVLDEYIMKQILFSVLNLSVKDYFLPEFVLFLPCVYWYKHCVSKFQMSTEDTVWRPRQRSRADLWGRGGEFWKEKREWHVEGRTQSSRGCSVPGLAFLLSVFASILILHISIPLMRQNSLSHLNSRRNLKEEWLTFSFLYQNFILIFIIVACYSQHTKFGNFSHRFHNEYL